MDGPRTGLEDELGGSRRRQNLHDRRGRLHGEIFIVYPDAETGEQRAATARTGDFAEHGFLMQRAVHVKNPMGPDEAQALADEAIAVLGGRTATHAWFTLSLDHEVARGDGSKQRASEIKQGDSIMQSDHDRMFYVLGLTRDADAGTVLLTLGEQGHQQRLDMELRLQNLEVGL